VTFEVATGSELAVNLSIRVTQSISEGLTLVNSDHVRLPNQLNAAEEIQLRISFRGQLSNPGSITMAASF